jgi:hypothetical protein
VPLLVCSFDTTAKTLSVTLDGAPVPDVTCVEFERSWERPGDYAVRLVTGADDRAGGLTTRTTVTAAAEPAGKPSLAAELAAFWRRG